MPLPTVRVLLDDVPVEVQLAQGDYVRAERDGYRFTEHDAPSSVANACVCFHALARAKRRGLIDGDVPETFDDFLDAFAWDIDFEEPEDPEGKDSSQGTSTG